MELISRGAEAELYLEGDRIIKKRIPKRYRNPEMDMSIRKSRTRREAKVLEKLPEGVDAPKLIKMDDKEMIIEMSLIMGPKIRDILESQISLSSTIGKKIALLHNAGIIHGDLTTSNMILSSEKVYLIDFGLSYFSEKTEDKAVDLHLLRQALESKHHAVAEQAFSLVLEGYSSESADFEAVHERFLKVEARGRNKNK